MRKKHFSKGLFSTFKLLAFLLLALVSFNTYANKKVLFLTKVDATTGSYGSGDSVLVKLLTSTFSEIKAEDIKVLNVADPIVNDAVALNAYDLIFSSAYVGSGDIKGKAGLIGTTSPYINAEAFAWQDHGWIKGGVHSPDSTTGKITITGDFGGITGLWKIGDSIASHTKLLAQVHAVDRTQLAPGAIELATLIDKDPANGGVGVATAAFVIPVGGILANSNLAPGKRVGIYLRDDVPLTLVEGGELFFTRVVAWCLDLPMPGDKKPVTRTSIENGGFGSPDAWNVVALGKLHDVDFNYSVAKPKGGVGSCLRMSHATAEVNTAVYQELKVVVGAEYDFSMLAKNLSGNAKNQWLEILLAPKAPIAGDGFDGLDAFVITKVDGWGAACLASANTYDGDLGMNHCDFSSYKNMAKGGKITVVANAGEKAGDVVSRFFVIKFGVCCTGAAPDWVIDEIVLKKATTRTAIENGGFGSQDAWSVVALGKLHDLDFNYSVAKPKGGVGSCLRMSHATAEVNTAVYQELKVVVGAEYDFSMLAKNLSGNAKNQWLEILLAPKAPIAGDGFDGLDAFVITKVDGWGAACLASANTYDGDLGKNHCDFSSYKNMATKGKITVVANTGEKAGDLVSRYFVIKFGVCCTGAAPDWVIDEIVLKKGVTRTSIENGGFGSSDAWNVVALGKLHDVDFNYSVATPTGGKGSSLRMSHATAEVNTAVYQELKVVVGKEYNFSMLAKNLSGNAKNQWLEILLAPKAPIAGDGFDGLDAFVITKVDGWGAACLASANTYDGDLGKNHCDFSSYKNMATGGKIKVVADAGEKAGDIVSRFFVIKFGVCCTGAAPDWVIDEIVLKEPRTSLENGGFGSSDAWSVVALGKLHDVDFNYSAAKPTGGVGSCLRMSHATAEVNTAVYQELKVVVGKDYDFSMLAKNLSGNAKNQWLEILLAPKAPIAGDGFDGLDPFVITKVDGWGAACLASANTYDGDLGKNHCDFSSYKNMASKGKITVVANAGEKAGDLVTRYFVIKFGVCCTGAAPDWVIDEIVLKESVVIANGGFGSQAPWKVANLEGSLNVDFNYTAVAGPTGGEGASLRISNDAAKGHTVVYQEVSVTVGAKYDISMLVKDLSGVATDQWVEVLLSPVMPVDAKGYDHDAFVITKMDTWACKDVTKAYNGDLGKNHCAFAQYPNMATNGKFTAVANTGEKAGDVVTRYFVIKVGASAKGANWAFDNIKLDKVIVVENVIVNGEFGSQSPWEIAKLEDPLNVDFNYTAVAGPTGGAGASLRISNDAAKGHTTVFQKVKITVGTEYDLSMLVKDLSGVATDQWVEILLSPVMPVEGKGYDHDAFVIAKMDTWACKDITKAYNGDLGKNHCVFANYPNMTTNGKFFAMPNTGEKIGDVVDRYFVIKVGASAKGANWAFDNITLVKGDNVLVAVTGVKIDKATANVFVGKTVQLTATVNPTGATNKAVKWSSSDAKIAKVDANGLVTALAKGTATITVTTVDGAKTATCAITVDPNGVDDNSVNSFKVYPNPASSNFSIQLNGTESANVLIYNNNGQLVFEKQATERVINITNKMKSGMYLIYVVDKSGRSTSQKLLIK